MQDAQVTEVEPTTVEAVEITLKLSVKEVEVVLGALAKLPLEAVADLFFKIRNDATVQIQPSGEPK